MTTLKLVPAFGRDYKSQAEILRDWVLNKDFIIADYFNKWDGKPASRESATQGGYSDVQVRYAGLRKLTTFKVGAVPTARGSAPRRAPGAAKAELEAMRTALKRAFEQAEKSGHPLSLLTLIGLRQAKKKDLTAANDARLRGDISHAAHLLEQVGRRLQKLSGW